MKQNQLKNRKTKNKLSKNAKEEKRVRTNFRNKIKKVFITAGFSYLNTENKHINIGNRKVEIDFIFVSKNIILICEDTFTKSENIKDHARNKQQAFNEIKNNFNDLYKWMDNEFSNSYSFKYSSDEYKVIFLYFSQQEINFSTEDYKLFSPIKFVSPQTLSYLFKMSKFIQKSVKYEIFRFLGLTKENLNTSTTESSEKTIKATIISPKKATGIQNGVRIVSFMMSAETLIKNCYVLRKDNWEDSILLYQRLIQEQKIKNIRNFLVKKQEAFYNNIIVALPKEVSFRDQIGQNISIDKIGDYEVCTMTIPDEMNTICIIDGQHRVYAHYEGLAGDKHEITISSLRKELHLLVTGLVFPREMSETEKIKIQSEIFLDINSNAKPVSQDVLLHIQMVKSPLSDLGLARAIIERLNKEQIFLKKFEMSSLDQGKIKTSSIIKFALRYLVTITPREKASLYSLWDGDKDLLNKMHDKSLEEYKNFCVKHISQYFAAIKNCYKKYWENPESKILSVISINGFILAYIKLIEMYGIKDFDFYKNIFDKLKIDFSKEKFPYTSSQYAKFSRYIINQIENNQK